jgi:hypothetical protein
MVAEKDRRRPSFGIGEISAGRPRTTSDIRKAAMARSLGQPQKRARFPI